MQTIQRKQIAREDALDAVNRFLGESIHPASPGQVKRVDQRRLARWLRESSFSAGQKEQVLTFLKPALADGGTAVVMMRGVRLKQQELTANVALIGIPDAVRAELGTDLVVVFEHGEGGGDTIDTCQYRSCFRAYEGGSGICTTATQFNETCPPNECATDSDCGSGDGGSGITILEVLEAL